MDPEEVESSILGDHEELVGDRELDVAPRVQEQLRELGLFDLDGQQPVGQLAEEASAPSTASSVRPETIWGSRSSSVIAYPCAIRSGQ